LRYSQTCFAIHIFWRTAFSEGRIGAQKFRRGAFRMISKRTKRNIPGARPFFPLALLLALSLALAGPANAQKKNKNNTPPANPVNALPDEQRIEYAIGQMLAAWQLGDTTTMHKYYTEDVSVVAGTWTPPAIGWTNYLAAYQLQRTRMQQVRLERSNTLIRVVPGGTVAWACYQWDFSAVVDGSQMAAQGQTTLVFEKRGDDWLIAHNHTSLVQASQPTAPTNPSPQPAAPAPAKP
jgi:ketosteroid isomerase-like protein